LARGKPLDRGIGILTMVSVALRSLLLEASWNYRGMQNLGFCFSIMPALKKLTTKEALRSAAMRHLAFFNTNPYLSTFVMGTVLQAEALRAGQDVDEERLSQLKSSLGGALGAMGDELIWSSAKPCLCAAAVLVALMGHTWAFIWLVGCFVIINLSLRVMGVVVGIRGKEAVQRALESLSPRRRSASLRRVTCVLLGAIVGVVLAGGWRPVAQSAQVGLLTAVPVVVVVSFLLRGRKVSSARIGIGLCLVTLLTLLLV